MTTERIRDLEECIRKVWGILWTAVGDEGPPPATAQLPGQWLKLKYGACAAMWELEEAMQGQSMSMPKEKA